MADVIKFRNNEESGPTSRSKATLIGPDSVLVLSPKLLIVIVGVIASFVVSAVSLYGRVDRRIEKTEASAAVASIKLESEVATKRDLSDLGKDLRAEIRAVSDAASNMRMHCEPTRGGGMRCQVRETE